MRRLLASFAFVSVLLVGMAGATPKPAASVVLDQADPIVHGQTVTFTVTVDPRYVNDSLLVVVQCTSDYQLVFYVRKTPEVAASEGFTLNLAGGATSADCVANVLVLKPRGTPVIGTASFAVT